MENVLCNFKPTPDMELSRKQVQMCAYLFHPHNDPLELMFKIGETIAIRADFMCLCPDNRVDGHILAMMASKTTWETRHTEKPCVWSLPPSFSADILDGNPTDRVLDDHLSEFMPAYMGLKYIYAPLKDEGNHWYLMVVSINDRLIYHFDSHLPAKCVSERRSRIRIVSEKLVEMMNTKSFPLLSQKEFDMDVWEIVDAKGIPDCEGSENSAIWVMEWLCMEDCFQPNQPGALNENRVRMRVGLELLMTSHNEYAEALGAMAENFWDYAI